MGFRNFFCNAYEKQEFKGEDELIKILEKYRSKNNKPDCLVGFSGGRDSSYGLHLLKEKFKMNPIAYTYDWGLTTDNARINAAKICGKLGIQHATIATLESLNSGSTYPDQDGNGFLPYWSWLLDFIDGVFEVLCSLIFC